MNEACFNPRAARDDRIEQRAGDPRVSIRARRAARDENVVDLAALVRVSIRARRATHVARVSGSLPMFQSARAARRATCSLLVAMNVGLRAEIALPFRSEFSQVVPQAGEITPLPSRLASF